MNAFQKIAGGQSACLLEAALDIATDEYPDLNVAAYLEQMQLMAEGFDIFLAGETSDRGILRALNDFFFQELEFSGNTGDYYDPRNSYLNEVIDRKLGIPISLSVLYQYLARSAGIRLAGVNFPGHFLLAYSTTTGHRLYIDVFHGGQWLEWEDCVQRLQHSLALEQPLEEDHFPLMADSEILVRILRNLKGIYSRNDFGRCLRVQERLVQLVPADPAELRDLGLLYYHNGKSMLAMQTLESLVKRFPAVQKEAAVREYLGKAVSEAVLLN